MLNIVVDMCEKFHDDRLRNDRALVLLKYDKSGVTRVNRRWTWGVSDRPWWCSCRIIDISRRGNI